MICKTTLFPRHRRPPPLIPNMLDERVDAGLLLTGGKPEDVAVLHAML
ncbi:MAG: hypothetical protein H0S77_03400 [Spirochaetaceae bacterium]|nr:hypothetical protein [Spirochaetaceae bacterium]